MYQALYRKYRPTTFDDVYGQKNIVETLKNAILNNKLSHAYLFCGPRGTGKTSIAKIIAKTVNCENLNGYLPCNKCVNCTQNTIDIIEIDAASNNGVDEIREIKNKISLVPTYGKYKIYIIDEVHMLTISAFNALLKTLEEPPKHIIFILATTDPQKVPATILSRCQKFDFKRIDNNSIQERIEQICGIENIEIEKDAISEIARISDGGLRDAVNLLDQAYSYTDKVITLEDIHEINGTLTQHEIAKFYTDFINNDLTTILNKIDEYNSCGKNLIKLAQEFVLFLRNTIVYMKAKNYLIEKNIDVEPYQEICGKLELSKMLELINELNNSINLMKQSQNPKLIFELLFIKCINNSGEIEKNISREIKTEKKEIENISQKVESETIVKEKHEIENKKIDDELKQIKIDNTLACFSKQKLVSIKTEIEKIKSLLLNNRYSQFVSLILDGSIRAASEKNLLFMYELKTDSEMFNNNLNIIEEIIEKSLGNNYSVISVDKNEWEIIKNEFNNHLKKYEYKEEKKIKENNENNIKQMFDSIIEYR